MRNPVIRLSNAAKIVRSIENIKNWPTFLADQLSVLRNGEYELRFRDGTTIHVRSNTVDGRTAYGVIAGSAYNPAGFEIDNADTVVDVGAHIGSFTVYSARRAHPGSVFSLEPVEENSELLLRNIQANNLDNVVPVKKAMAGDTGKRSMYLSRSRNDGHSLYHASHCEERLVETVTLEQFMANFSIGRIDFLKLDCEGAEYEIIMGCSDATLGRIRKISMEYHVGPGLAGPVALKKFLDAKGYQTWMTSPARGCKIFAKRV